MAWRRLDGGPSSLVEALSRAGLADVALARARLRVPDPRAEREAPIDLRAG